MKGKEASGDHRLNMQRQHLARHLKPQVRGIAQKKESFIQLGAFSDIPVFDDPTKTMDPDKAIKIAYKMNFITTPTPQTIEPGEVGFYARPDLIEDCIHPRATSADRKKYANRHLRDSYRDF